MIVCRTALFSVRALPADFRSALQRIGPLRSAVSVDTFDRWMEQINRRPGRWLSLFAALLAVQISPWWYPTEDSCTYLSLARSVASGEGLTGLGQPRVGIPPGYPLLISPAFWWDHRPFLVLACLQWLLAVAMMLGVYRWMRRHCHSAAVLITGLTTVNMGVWYYYRRPLKEIAFMTVVIWTVNFLHDLLRSSNSREMLRRAVPAALLLIVTVLIRYSGVVLIAGFGVACLVQLSRSDRLRSRAMPLLGAIGAAGVVVSLIVMHVGGAVYLQGFAATSADLGSRLADGIWLQINGIGRATVPGMFKAYSERGQWWDVNMLIYLPVILTIACGWWQLVRRHPDVLALTLPFYLALYVAWPFDQGARFVIPMVPVLMACLWFGRGLLLWNRSVVFGLLFVGHLGAAMGYWLVVDAPRAREAHAYWTAVDRICESIPTDRDKVWEVGIPDKMDLMLRLELDRYLSAPDEPHVPRADIRWIVQPVDHPPPSEFALKTVVDNLQVLARRPQALDTPSPTFFSDSSRPSTRQR